MDFNVARADQLIHWEHSTKATMYRNLNDEARHTEWIRIAGLGVAIASGLICLVARVCGIVEMILKAFINIVCAPFFTDCMLLTGLKQLAVGVPLHIILVILTPVYLAVGIVVTTPGLLIAPLEYSKWRFDQHIHFRDKFLPLLS